MGKQLAKYDPNWAAYAEQYAQEERGSGNLQVSTRGGVLRVGEDEMPGNRICVLIMDSVHENTYYGKRFDPDNILPPICFAIGRDARELAPHEAMDDHDYFQPQADSCAECPMAEWGSSDTGRGKACSNRRRLLVMPAGAYTKVKGSRGEYELEIFDDEAHFEQADMAVLKLPVTSVKNYTKFVQLVAKRYGRPPFGVYAEIYIEPDPKSQYKVCFDLIEEVPDELAEVITARHEEAKDMIEEPYSPPMDEPSEGKKRKSRR
jgi:hypothetical protein